MNKPINILEEFDENSKILFIEPHPDDACLGCGALIKALWFKYTGNLHLMTITQGESAFKGKMDTKDRIIERKAETAHYVKSMQLKHIQLEYPDGNIEEYNKPLENLQVSHCLSQVISNYIINEGISHVFIPPKNDEHPDHSYIHFICRHKLTALSSTITHKAINFYEYENATAMSNFTHYIQLHSDSEYVDHFLYFYPNQAKNFQLYISGMTGLAKYRGMQVCAYYFQPDLGIRYAQVFNKLK